MSRSNFYDFFRLKNNQTEYTIKQFRNKLWVVELLNENDVKAKIPFMVHVFNVLTYPLKYIPRKTILRMSDYKIYTFRVGSVMNGFSVDIQIPKKFSFK